MNLGALDTAIEAGKIDAGATDHRGDCMRPAWRPATRTASACWATARSPCGHYHRFGRLRGGEGGRRTGRRFSDNHGCPESGSRGSGLDVTARVPCARDAKPPAMSRNCRPWLDQHSACAQLGAGRTIDTVGVDKGTSHGLRCRTACSQPQHGRLFEGDRAQATDMVHAGGADRLPDRHLYPGPRRRRLGHGGDDVAARRRHPRHVRHVHRRRVAAHDRLRAEHHALHQRQHHHPVDVRRVPRSRRSRKKASRGARSSTNTPAI